MLELRASLLVTLVGVVWAGAGCAGTPPSVRTAGAKQAVATPSVITPGTYDGLLRTFWGLALDDPRRRELRDRLVEHLINESAELLGTLEGPQGSGSGAANLERYEAVVDQLAAITGLYLPEELEFEVLPAGLGALADYVVQHGSPIGDEGRVLSALYIRYLLAARQEGPAAQEAARAYQRLQHWGFDVRSGFSSPIERFEGLVEAWEEHARLTPAPEVLDQLADLYVSRRNAVVQHLRSESRSMGIHPMVLQHLQRTSLEVAAVYLRHADIASALQRVEQTNGGGASETQLVQWLRDVRDGGRHGSSVTLSLARVYKEHGRRDVAQALCRHGWRNSSPDPDFARCLAEISVNEGDYAGATAWYAAAIERAPDERVLYDEALEMLSHLISQGLVSTDASRARALAARANAILEERARRWPDSPAPVTPEQLYYALGIAEMNAGNAKSAEDRLRASLAARESVEALMQLAFLVERTNRPHEAVDLYRRALELAPREGAIDDRQRAELLERLGDAQRSNEQPAQAKRSYGQAIETWGAALPAMKGPMAGAAHVRRGVVLDRLGRRAEALEAFEAALEAAPGERNTYAGILSYFVVAPRPDAAFAARVLRRSLRQLTLDPEWKVYFALWVRGIDARVGAPVDPEVVDVFSSVPRVDEWWSHLARLGAGEISHAQLLEQAADIGHRAEAHFYAALMLLERREVAQAKVLLQEVLDTQMVNFFEHAMAQELMASLQADEPASSTTRPGAAQLGVNASRETVPSP